MLKRILFAVSLLLPVDACASYLPTQEWSWQHVTTNASGGPANVVKYRLYWHPSPGCYLSHEYIEVDAAMICNEPYCDPGRCCFEPGEPLGDLVFLTITAVNSSGIESLDPRRKETCP